MRRRSTGDASAAWTSEEGSFRRLEPGGYTLPQENGSTTSTRVQKAATFPYQGPTLSPFGLKMGVAQSMVQLGQDAMMGLTPQPLSFPEALQYAEVVAMDRQQSSDSSLDTLFDPSLPISPDETYLPDGNFYRPDLFSPSFLVGLSQDLVDEPAEFLMKDEPLDLCYLLGPYSEDYNIDRVLMQGVCSTESQLGEASAASKLIIDQGSAMAGPSGNIGPTTAYSEDEEESDCHIASKDENANLARPQGGKTFACPYYRLDPIQHIDCISRKLNRIQDIKQHLSRRHFVKQGEQDVLDNTERVSFSAQESLKTRVDRRLPARKQWHTIWSILFKTADLKGSPYLGDTEEEVIGIALDIFQNQSNGRISGLLKNRGLPVSPGKNVQRLMTGLFEESRCCSKQAEQEPDLAKSRQFEVDQASNNTGLHTNPASELGSSASSSTGRDDGHESAILTSPILTPCDGVLNSLRGNIPETNRERDSSLLMTGLIRQSVEQELVTQPSLAPEFPVQMQSTNSGCHFEDTLTMEGQPEPKQEVHDTSTVAHLSRSSTPKSPSASSFKVGAPQARRKGWRRNRGGYRGTATSTVKPMWECCHCSMVNPYGNAQVCPNYPCEHQYNPNCCLIDKRPMKKRY